MILFIIKVVKILMLIKCLCSSPQIVLTIELEWLACFGHVVLSLLEHMSFWCPFFDSHLSTYHSNIGVQIIVVLELGMSTLAWRYQHGCAILFQC